MGQHDELTTANSITRTGCAGVPLSKDFKKKFTIIQEHEEITIAFQKVVTAIGDVCTAIIELTAVAAKALTPVVKILAEAYENNKTLILAAGCPNKRVLHLARYGKKARTRKKNINRLKKWIERKGAQ